MKKCIKCDSVKDVNEFRVNARAKDGRQGTCKKCKKTSEALFRMDNIDKIRKRNNKYYVENSEKIKQRAKQWEIDNVERVKKRKKRYREKNKESIKAYSIEYVSKNKNRLKEYYRSWYSKNIEKVKNSNKIWRESNPERMAAYKVEWEKRFLTTPEGKTLRFMRNCLRRCLADKNGSTTELLGYTPQELKAHLESRFENDMTWNNRGAWHIDHIKPIAQFIKEGIIDPSIINALDNLQPLWAIDNLSKGSKYDN